MPYLHSRIEDKHKARCKDPKSKRVYIREYDEDTKKRIFTPLGIFCPSCKIIILDSAVVAETASSKSKPEVKAKPEIARKNAISKEQLSVYGDVTNCVVCGELCLATYHWTEDGYGPKGIFGVKPVPKQYRGEGMSVLLS